MASGRYYQRPYINYRVRAFYMFDIIMLLVVAAIVVFVLPIDFSVGISGTAIARQEEIARRLEEEKLPARYISGLFRTSASKRIIQYDAGGNGIYKRTSFPWGEGYVDWRFSGFHDMPLMKIVPYCWFAGDVQLGVEDSSVYYQSKGYSGWVNNTNVESMYHDAGSLDYHLVMDVLKRDASGAITLREAAGLMHLINSGVLVGFSADTAWFRTDQDDTHWRVVGYNTTGKRVQEIQGISETKIGLYVINNTYLFKDVDGKIHIRNLRTGEQGNLVLESPVVGLEYAVKNNGEVFVFFITQEQPAYGAFRMTGTGIEYTEGTQDTPNSNPVAIQASVKENYISCTVFCETGNIEFGR